jgi:hypothetical protein
VIAFVIKELNPILYFNATDDGSFTLSLVYIFPKLLKTSWLIHTKNMSWKAIPNNKALIKICK